MTDEEARKAIEKYQEKHPLQLGIMLDVTAISSKEGVDIISQTIERVSKKVEENTELWCICEMAKMYMQGVKPVYPVKLQGEWIFDNEFTEFGNPYGTYRCSVCGGHSSNKYSFCKDCGADMRPKPNQLRDCENCVHHSENGCEVWKCEFKRRSS